jgi:hypothetical protein
MDYRDWAHTPNFPTDVADLVVGRGATPLLTWEPWNYAAGVNQPTYRLSTIANDTHDALVRRWATQIKAWGKPLGLVAQRRLPRLGAPLPAVPRRRLRRPDRSGRLQLGTTDASGWQSFEQVFGPSIAQVRALSATPLVLAEIGSAEQGGDKAAWITDFFARLAARPEVRGFLWFNHDKEADWRVQSSDASRIAYAAGVAASRYV